MVGKRKVVEDKMVVVVVVVVDGDGDELDKESCDEESAVETKLKEETIDAKKPEEVD